MNRNSIEKEGSTIKEIGNEKNEKVSKWYKFRIFLINYCEHSSFHGVWHLTKYKRNHSFEIAFWCVTICGVLVLANYNILTIWNRYLYNATMITIDRDYLERNTTFPPVTLCLRQRLNESATEEFLISKGYNSSQRNDVKLRKFLQYLSNFSLHNLGELINIKQNNFKVDDYLDILLRISNRLPQHITLSFLPDEKFFFEQILLDELGLCYTFNSKISLFLSPSYLVSGNLENNSTMKMLKEINYFDGESHAVTSDLSNNVDIYYHGPYNLPSNLRKIFIQDPDHNNYATFEVIPLVILSEDNVRNLFEFQRKCKFPEESTLTYFPLMYSRDLCLYECRMKKFVDLCKCLPFFYGQSRDGTKRCQQNGLKCIVHSKAIIDSLRADVDCGCLEDCNDIKYSLQASHEMPWFHNSSVSWALVQTKVIYKRELIHGFIEALILTGGSLSLFIGMSCLTMVEVFFFIYYYVFK